MAGWLRLFRMKIRNKFSIYMQLLHLKHSWFNWPLLGDIYWTVNLETQLFSNLWLYIIQAYVFEYSNQRIYNTKELYRTNERVEDFWWTMTLEFENNLEYSDLRTLYKQMASEILWVSAEHISWYFNINKFSTKYNSIY